MSVMFIRMHTCIHVFFFSSSRSENTALAVPVKPSENASKKPKKAKVSQQADVNTATVSKEASPAAGSTTSKKQKASESVVSCLKIL